MYCRKCGSLIPDNSTVCPNCAETTTPMTDSSTVVLKQNVMAFIGFILSFFVAIGGLVCSIIAYKKAKNENYNGKSMALAGIIISAVSIGAAIIATILVLGLYAALLAVYFA